MTYSLNNVSPQGGHYIESNHRLWVVLGGQLYTILLALVILLIIKFYKTIWAYPFLFLQFFCRFFSLVFGEFSNQDEPKISIMMGLGKYTIAISVILPLLFIIWRGSYILKLNYKSNWYFFTVSVFCELLMIASYKVEGV